MSAPHSQRFIEVQVYAEELDARERSVVTEVTRAINGLQNEFVILPKVKRISLPGQRALQADASFERLERLGGSKYPLCITSRRFANNDFQQASELASLVTVYDWERDYAPPGLRAYLTYQFAYAFVCRAANHTSDNTLFHKKTMGCRMDFCGNKRDIRLGMMAGYLCGDCQGALSRLGATRRQVDAIKRILHYVHEMATGDKEHVDWDEAFVVMRFKTGSEHQKAFEQGIRPALEAVGIKPTRGDDLVQSRPILEKVLEQMRRARFIVAQVDAKRMNIFYELEFAMGAEKDVLLISTREKFELPSDLSNWECLTYRAGDYGSLKEGIIRFFEGNYHRQRTSPPRNSRP